MYPPMSSSPQPLRNYFFRSLEFTSIMVFFVYMVLLAAQLISWKYYHFNWWQLLVTLLLVPLSYIMADFVSGFVHFLADNFGSEKTFFFGPKFIYPFRLHHVDPTEITRHGFIEVNGNNCLVSLFVLIPLYHFFTPFNTLTYFVSTLALFFLFFIFLTNQLHKWAHTSAPPRFVAWLQKYRLILSPTVHNRHHTAPFATYYCITSGWLNPILAKYGIFERKKQTNIPNGSS